MSWIVWLVLAAVLGVAELLTVTLTLGLIAVAAGVAAAVGAFGAPVPFQILAFVVTAVRARNVERLGRYCKTLQPGMNCIVPFIDRVKPLSGLRGQVVSFRGALVITEDNLVVLIDTVLFFQVTDPRAADYEIVDY